jgi:hypothetical protein
MAFVLLIVEKREDRLNRPKDVGRGLFDQMIRFRDRLQTRGILRACESLKPDTEGVRIAARGGKRSTVDGPFTEAKEFVGGFFLIDVPTRDQALAIASECPAVDWATVEVRETGPCHGD